MNGIVAMAKILKERENPSFQGISVGEVVSAPPKLKVKVNGLLIEKDELVVAEHLLAGYKRKATPTFVVSGTTVGDHGSHTHTVAIAEIIYTDTLVVGDMVIIVPGSSDQLYFLIDKVGDL